MSDFMYIIAVGIPVSALLCLVHALFRRRMDLVTGGLPIVGALALFSLIVIALS